MQKIKQAATLPKETSLHTSLRTRATKKARSLSLSKAWLRNLKSQLMGPPSYPAPQSNPHGLRPFPNGYDRQAETPPISTSSRPYQNLSRTAPNTSTRKRKSANDWTLTSNPASSCCPTRLRTCSTTLPPKTNARSWHATPKNSTNYRKKRLARRKTAPPSRSPKTRAAAQQADTRARPPTEGTSSISRRTGLNGSCGSASARASTN